MRDISRLPHKRKRLGTSESEVFVPSYNIQRKRLGVSLLEEQRRQRKLKRLARLKAKEKAVKIKPKIDKAEVPKKKKGIVKKKRKIKHMAKIKVKRVLKVRKSTTKIKPKIHIKEKPEHVEIKLKTKHKAIKIKKPFKIEKIKPKIKTVKKVRAKLAKLKKVEKHKPVKKEKSKKEIKQGIKIKVNLPKIDVHKRVFEISKRVHGHIKSHAVRHTQNIKELVKKHGKGFWQKSKEMDQKALRHLKKAHSALKGKER